MKPIPGTSRGILNAATDSNPPPGKLEAILPEPLRRYHCTEFSSENSRVPSPVLLDGDEATGDDPSNDSDGL